MNQSRFREVRHTMFRKSTDFQCETGESDGSSLNSVLAEERTCILKPGLKLLDETEGTGKAAANGDTVKFESLALLSRGDVAQDRLLMTIRLGGRKVIAGVEYGLIGMKPGGYRKVRVSPHLAYGDEGVPGRVPPNAVMVYELWMKSVR